MNGGIHQDRQRRKYYSTVGAFGITNLARQIFDMSPVTPQKRTIPFNQPPGRKRTKTFPSPYPSDYQHFGSTSTSSGYLSELIDSNMSVANHALESAHGGSVYSGQYQGTFGTPHSGYEAKAARYLKAGCGVRDFITGNVTTGVPLNSTTAGVGPPSQAVYVGHSSYFPELIMRVVCQALVRKLWYKATGRDITNPDSVLLANTNAQNVGLQYYDMVAGSTGTHNFVITAGTTTLATLAQSIATSLWSDIGSQVQYEYTYVYLYNGTNEGLALSVSGMTVDVCTESFLKIQNVTSQTTSSGSDFGNAADVQSIPLQGIMYNGTGNFAMPKSTKEVNVASAGNANPWESSGTHGFMGASYYNRATAPSGDKNIPNQPYFSLSNYYQLPQKPEQFTNVNSGKGVKLSPGVIKVDRLSYCKELKFNTFINNIIVVPDSVAPNGTTNVTAQRTHRGQFRMFALTPMLHTITNIPSNYVNTAIWYELWYECFARVSVVHEEQFMLNAPTGTVDSFVYIPGTTT